MRWWRLVLTASIVVLLGVAFAYPLVATATDDVGFCTTCHIMEKQGQTHAASFHRKVATCSDCHTGSLVQKYTDGVRHITANLTGAQPEQVHIRQSTRTVVAGQCAECHNPLSLHARTKQSKGQNCLDCHSGHDPRPIKLPGQ